MDDKTAEELLGAAEDLPQPHGIREARARREKRAARTLPAGGTRFYAAFTDPDGKRKVAYATPGAGESVKSQDGRVYEMGKDGAMRNLSKERGLSKKERRRRRRAAKREGRS